MSNLGSLSPVGEQQFFDDSGLVLNGGFLFFYLSGTSTPSAPYHDVGLTTPWTNPIVLNSAGRPGGGIYLDPAIGSYKMIRQTSLGVPVGATIDPVPVTNAGTAGLGMVFDFGGNSAAAITNTSYPSGATYDKLQPGTGTWVVDSGTLPGTYVLQATGFQSGGGTLSVSIMDLDDGSPDTPLATLTITSATGQTANSGAITFAAPGVQKHYGVKTLVSANTGFAWSIKIVRTS